MNKKINIEFILGLLILTITVICFFFYFSKVNILNEVKPIKIYSSFLDIGNMSIGNDIKIKGVKVGEVTGIRLDQENFMAIITSSVEENIIIPNDSIFKYRIMVL